MSQASNTEPTDSGRLSVRWWEAMRAHEAAFQRGKYDDAAAAADQMAEICRALSFDSREQPADSLGEYGTMLERRERGDIRET